MKETTIADLLAHGDFGLGTFNELDGEMIAFSSQVYQLRADGSARAKPEQKTPFAVMTWFQPQYRKTFDTPVSRQQIHDAIDQQIPSDNLFCALRIDGNFRHAHTRTVPRQTPPYRAMTDVLDDQPVFRFNQREGVLVGFRTPQHMQGINVAGYHEHFITDDRQGGHLLDYQLESGVLTFGEIHKLMIDLPADSAFCRPTFTPAISMPPSVPSKTNRRTTVNSDKQSRQWAHGADMVVGQLEAQGVKQVFGIPARKSTKSLIPCWTPPSDYPGTPRSERGVYGGSGRAVDRQSRGGAGHLRAGLFEPDHRHGHRQQRRRPGGGAGRGGEAGG
jgi:acetolactate decarboxylase